MGSIHPAGWLALRVRLIQLAVSMLFAPAAWAQGTVIVPDAAGSAFAAGTTVSTASHVSTIDGGTLSGTNLFHSFATFNLAAGDTAQWTTTLTDPASVTNVINRVTGGTASQIGGTLDSTGLPSAAFFFINPAGIVFGKDASVNVPGAAWFSTGKTLNFADGSMFSATTASGSTFSIAAPQSFGFLGQEGDIALQGTTELLANPASSVGLVGANLTTTDAAVSASGAMLAAVGDQTADIALDGSGAEALGGAITMERSTFTIAAGSDAAAIVRGGSIALDDAWISTTGGAGLMIHGAALSLGGRSVVLTSDEDLANAGDITIGVGDLAISGASIVRSITVGSADAGHVAVEAATLRMQENAEISSLTFDAGNAGGVEIKAGTAVLDGSARIFSDSTAAASCLDLSCAATGNAGQVDLALRSLRMQDNAVIASSTYGPGKAGALTIRADVVDLSGNSIITSASTYLPACQDVSCVATGDAGKILLASRELHMSGQSIIFSDTAGPGNAGNLVIEADTADLADQARILSNSTYSSGCADVSCSATGNAGDISLNARILRMQGDTVVSSSTFGLGKAGALTIRADAVDLSGTSSITSASSPLVVCQDFACVAAGDAGDIKIVSRDLHMSDQSLISSDTFGSGKAGNLEIEADVVDLSGQARVLSDSIHNSDCEDVSCSATGNAGDITLNTRLLRMRGHAILSSDTYGSGKAGDLLINADTVDLSDRTYISSDSTQTFDCNDASCSATGNAGGITVLTRQLLMSGQSVISSDTYGSGKAGTLMITAETADISGNASISSDSTSSEVCGDASCSATGNAGDLALHIKELQVRDTAQISSDTYGSGMAGSISVEGETIHLTDSAGISSNSEFFVGCAGQFCQASGDAGNIKLTADTILLEGLSSISSDTTGTGRGGAIEIKARSLKLADVGTITTDSFDLADCSMSSCPKAGDAGEISITADALTIRDYGVISSVTAGSGDAGNILLKTADLHMSELAQVLSDTYGQASHAGKITIIADTAALEDNASISSVSSPLRDCADPSCRLSGEAGIILMKTGSLSLGGDTKISTTTEGTGNAGSIQIDTRGLQMTGGEISSKSTGCSDGLCTGGRSGEIAITAQTIGMSGAAQITTLSASAAQAGDIAVDAPEITIAGPASIASTNSGTVPVAEFVRAAAATDTPFRAGAVALTTTRLALSEGGAVTTNSAAGPAGIIAIAMPENGGILTLTGRQLPGVITTSSGPGTGGEITIANPLAIISNGGSILAKGQAAGADVQIASRYFIQSADRPNVIAVDGSIQLQSNLYDVSAGTAPPSLEFLDASRVLLGQCASARASGEASRISWRNVGPYAFLPLRGATLAMGAAGLLDMPPC